MDRNFSLKTLVCSTGSGMDKHTVTIQLSGIDANEKLTPKMARRALQSALFFTGTVYSDDGYSYRVYAKSARKISNN